MEVKEFTDYSDGSTTINGTSVAMPVKSAVYQGTPYSVQITDSSSAVGVIQAIIMTNDTDSADASSLWQDLTDGTISGDGLFCFFAPVTHIRVSLSSGTCKARILK